MARATHGFEYIPVILSLSAWGHPQIKLLVGNRGNEKVKIGWLLRVWPLSSYLLLGMYCTSHLVSASCMYHREW